MGTRTIGARRLLLLALACALGSGVAACDGDETSPAPPDPGTAGSAAAGGGGGQGGTGVAGTGGGGGQTALGLQRSGRWLTYDGEHLFFVGVDAQQLAADPALDYVAILDQFQSYRINKVRIWLDCYWNQADYLHPWAYDGASGRYDLDTWNDGYWSRVQQVVAAAEARDIIVEVSIFAGYPMTSSWWSSWPAWNAAFNDNGAFTTNADGHFFPEFFDLDLAETSSSGKTLADYQQALVDKALAELGPYRNVHFEVMNEFFEHAATTAGGYDVYPWQQHWADYLAARTTRPVTCHVHDGASGDPEGVQYFWDRPSVGVLNYHLYDADPGSVSTKLHDAQDKGKVLQCNESFEWYVDGAVDQANLDRVTREAWGWLVSGGYYAFYNGQHTEYAGWAELGLRARVLHDVADELRLWQMSPTDGAGDEVDSLLTQGPAGSNRQLLAESGSQYLAYFWGTPSATAVELELPDGDYAYRWYDPRNGDVLGSGTVAGGGTATVPAPDPSAWRGSVGVALLVLGS